MKTLVHSAAVSLTFFTGLAVSALAQPADAKPLVNAYGEPAGFGNESDVIIPNTKELNTSRSRGGTAGLYVFPNTFDPRYYESHGQWQDRVAAENRGQVIIGPLEVLDTGPTGPLTPDAQAAATDEVTAQVLTRIKATDKEMSALKSRAKSLDEETNARFKAAANEVAERRAALRENLRIVRAADGSEWNSARAAVAVSFNAYVQSLHQAEAAVPANS